MFDLLNISVSCFIHSNIMSSLSIIFLFSLLIAVEFQLIWNYKTKQVDYILCSEIIILYYFKGFAFAKSHFISNSSLHPGLHQHATSHRCKFFFHNFSNSNKNFECCFQLLWDSRSLSIYDRMCYCVWYYMHILKGRNIVIDVNYNRKHLTLHNFTKNIYSHF